MTRTFECPACGAPLDYDGVHQTQRCPFCNNSVIVPEELHPEHNHQQAQAVSPGSLIPVLGYEDLEKFKEVKNLIAAGKKIEAIKVYREITGLGLMEAKLAVEDLEAGKLVEINRVSTSIHTGSAAYSGASFEKSVALGKVANLALAGQKIEAIKLYRETFDVSLLEAKTAVESIQAGKLDQVAQMALGSGYIPQVKPQVGGVNPVKDAPDRVAAKGGSCLFLTISFILLVTFVPILIAMASNGGPLSGVWARVNPFAYARLSLSFGGEGTGPGRFTDARNITVDNHSGNLYATELKGGRVQVFDTAGKFLAQWAAGDSKTYITGMTCDRLGNLYLVIGGEINRYDGASGTLLGKIAYEDGNNFDTVAAAVDGGLVAFWDEFNDNLVRINKDGSLVWVTKSAISSVNEDSELERYLAIDGSGNVFVLGSFTNAVYKFSAAGKYVNRWGGEGDKKGQFYFPNAIAVDNRSQVYVADGKGIQVFDADGRYLARIPIPGSAFSLAITDKNELWVLTNRQTILKYLILK